MSDDFNLDREVSVEKNVDAMGRQWKIHINKANGLCYLRPEPDRVDAVIPKEMQGLWTKPSLLMPRLKQYLNDTWDKAEEANAKAERKRVAAREAAKEAAAVKKAKVTTKVEDDSGSASD